MPAKKKAFDFVRIDMPPKKPRQVGVVEMRGPYYTSISYGYLKGLLDDWSDYVDGYKFAGGSMRLLPRSRVKEIIRACHEHDLYVSTGGFVERVIVQGKTAVDQYLEECRKLGFDVVEVSSGLAPIPLKDKLEIVERVKKLGMKPKPEVSMMIGAGAGTHVTGYDESMRMRDFGEFSDEVQAHLKAGAKMIMVESEGLTEDLPPRKVEEGRDQEARGQVRTQSVHVRGIRPSSLQMVPDHLRARCQLVHRPLPGRRVRGLEDPALGRQGYLGREEGRIRLMPRLTRRR